MGVIGDVHCESETLSRVLDAFDAMPVDAVLCVGDLVDGPGDADATLALLQSRGVQCVAGNHERWFLDGERRDVADATLIEHDDDAVTRADLNAGGDAELEGGAEHRSRDTTRNRRGGLVVSDGGPMEGRRGLRRAGRVGGRRSEVRRPLVDEADHRGQRRIVAQAQVFLRWNVEHLANGQEGLRLFDRVDSQVRLKVEIKPGAGETGSLTIKYTDFDQLDYLRMLLVGDRR